MTEHVRSEGRDESDQLGPIDYFIVESPDGTLTQGGFDQPLDLIDRGIISLLDLAFIAKSADGGLAADEVVAALDATDSIEGN